MPSEVAHRVDTDQAYPVFRLAGVVDHASAPRVRSALLEVLAGQPEALVIDVDAVESPHPAAVEAIAQVARDTTDWPATRLALSTTGGTDGWAGCGIPVYPGQAAALTGLGPARPQDRSALTLEPVVGAARRARDLVTESCARWDRDDLAGAACIVVTEMVNNVVAHARTSMNILLARCGDSVRIAVRDSSATLPRFTGPVAPTAYGGRGLLLIDSVSDRWGTLGLHGGKVVWSWLTTGEPALPQPAEGIAGTARG